MEIRVLQYFLAVAREESISGAAESLHLSQPTLSRQLKDLEEELGKQLLIRGNRKISLTDEGMLLRKRAEEIVKLVQKTESELTLCDDIIAGDVYIGAGETDAVRVIAKTAQELQALHPQIRFHISSGDACDLVEQIDKGLLDFAILLGDGHKTSCHYRPLPMKDVWGVLMRKDNPLAQKDCIRAEDLYDQPLIVSRQAICQDGPLQWLKKDMSELNIVATYNLIYNASLMVDEGMGCAICLDKLINTTGTSSLCFKRIEPAHLIGMSIVWKKYQVYSKASEKFLSLLCRNLESEGCGRQEV